MYSKPNLTLKHFEVYFDVTFNIKTFYYDEAQLNVVFVKSCNFFFYKIQDAKNVINLSEKF